MFDRKEYYTKNREKKLEYQKQYRIKNLEKIKEYRNNPEYKEKDKIHHKQWVENNREKLNKYNNQYRIENKEKIEEWVIENREKLKKYRKQYNENNREKIIETSRQRRKTHPEYCKKCHKQWREKNPEYYKKYFFIKRKTDLKYNLNYKMCIAINISIKKNKNGRTWESLVGYTLADLIKRLKKTMPAGFTWQNFLSGELHIDHIIPIDAFNFTRPEHTDFLRCWALSNLRLLPAKENLRKSNKLDRPFQPALKI